MEKVRWLSRHQATEPQLAELRHLFGDDVSLTLVSETVPGAARVKELVAEHGATILVAVLPMPLVAELLGKGGLEVPFVRAAMERELQGDGSAIFYFSHFEKVVKVEFVVERL